MKQQITNEEFQTRASEAWDRIVAIDDKIDELAEFVDKLDQYESPDYSAAFLNIITLVYRAAEAISTAFVGMEPEEVQKIMLRLGEVGQMAISISKRKKLNRGKE